MSSISHGGYMMNKEINLNDLAKEFNMSVEFILACSRVSSSFDSLEEMAEWVHEKLGGEYDVAVTREKLVKESAHIWKQHKDKISQMLDYEVPYDPATITIIQALSQCFEKESVEVLVREFNMSSELIFACSWVNSSFHSLDEVAEWVHAKLGGEYDVTVTKTKLKNESQCLWNQNKDKISEIMDFEGNNPASISIIRSISQYC